MNGLELANVKPLIDQPHLKINRIRWRQIDFDRVNVEPEKESLNLNSLQRRDGAVTELTGDDFVVVDQILELNVTFFGQNDDEAAVVLEGVVDDGAGQEALREAEFGEYLEHSRRRRG